MLTEIELLDPADGRPTNVRATWFGRQFIKERFRPGQLIRLSGKVTHYGRWLQLAKPNVESADAERVHTGRMVPVYRLTEGLKEGHLRRWLHTAVLGDSKRGPVVGEVPIAIAAFFDLGVFMIVVATTMLTTMSPVLVDKDLDAETRE